ncbi:hypothetical protein CR513_12072, partial [Mucuna pruriens]
MLDLVILSFEFLQLLQLCISQNSAYNRLLNTSFDQVPETLGTRRRVTFLAKLISMKYKGRGNIREYIMEMSNLAAKLKSLKLELGEDLIKYKWSLNELISCKRKRGCREIILKVLILLQSLRIRKGRTLRMLRKDLLMKETREE